MPRTKSRKKLRAIEIERCVADFFEPRRNLVIPNVHWGFLTFYEADVLILTGSGCLYEVEIKTSLADLKNDFKKRHYHDDERIKYVWYAVPYSLVQYVERLAPEWTGILSIGPRTFGRPNTKEGPKDLQATQIRSPGCRSQYKATDKDRAKLGRLGSLRLWGLKKKIERLKDELYAD